MANLTNQFVSQSYQGLIKLEDSTQGLTSTLQPVTDGLNNPLPILVSATELIITGSFAGDGSNLTGITFDTSSIDTRIDSKLDSSSFENYTSSNDSKVNSLINATGSYLTELPDGLVSGSGQISYNGITDIPNGIVSSSSQITYSGLTGIPTGIVSGSEQISFNGITDIPTGLVSGSEQISFNSISDVPDGLISGSSQISDLGYATTGSNSFVGNQVITGSLTSTDDYIYLRSDSTGSLETPFGYSGVVIKNINGVEDAKIVVDNQGWLYAGRIGEEQRMAPIVYSPTNNYLAYWNGSGYLDFIDPDTFAPANGSINNNFNTNDLFVAGTLSSSNPIDGTFTGDGTGLSITLPTGIVSSSSQISYTGITDVPSGLVSGSSQISFNGITDVPAGLVSSSAQISYTGITDTPSNLVSSSAQIDITQTTGYGTFSSSVSKDNIYQLYQPDKTNPFVYTDNSGSLHIDGNIIQNGSAYETHAEKIYTTKDYIYLRSGSVGGLGVGEYTGIEAEKYDGVNNGRLVFDNQGWAKVGDAGSEQTLATRIDTPTNNYMAIWDDVNKRLDFVQQYQLPAGVVSGSSQISFNGITDVPSGLVSGSSQIIYSGITGIPSGSGGVTSYNDLTDIPVGIISGSIQVDVTQTTKYNTLATTGSNTFVGNQIITGSVTASSFIGDGSQLTNLPTSSLPAGVVSSSAQISFNGITDVPTGLISGSSQVSYTGLSNIPTGIVSSSAQISYTNISDKPSNLISGSSQISSLGFATTGSNSFNGTTIMTGSLEGNVVPITISSNTGSMDCGLGNFFTIQLTNADTHIIPTNINVGQTINLLVNTAAGNDVTFPSSVKQPSGSAYTPTNGTGKDVLTFVSFDDSTIYLANTKNLV